MNLLRGRCPLTKTLFSVAKDQLRTLSETAITNEQIAEQYKQQILYYPSIGQREIVGPSTKIEVCYFDQALEPFSCVRWGRDTVEARELQEKEKADWKLLSLEEKRRLYRHSFRQSISEVLAPDGEIVLASGMTMLIIGLVLWPIWYMRKTIYKYNDLPEKDDEYFKKILIRLIQQRQERITGIGSKWDYERGTWQWVKHAPRLRDFPEYEG